MARQFSPKVIAAIYTLIQAGRSIDETRQALLDGAVPGLKALPESGCPSRSTIAYHARKARAELEPVPDLDEYLNAFEAQAIRIIKRDVKRIDALPELTERDARLLTQHHKTLKGMTAAARDASHPDRKKGGEKRTDPTQPHNVLERIGRAGLGGNGKAEPVANGVDPPEGNGDRGTRSVDTSEAEADSKAASLASARTS